MLIFLKAQFYLIVSNWAAHALFGEAQGVMLSGISNGDYILRNWVKIIDSVLSTSPDVSNSLGESHIYSKTALTFEGHFGAS